MSRLPTGMFMPRNSQIHQLDAKTKLLSLIILLIAVVNADSLIGYTAVIVLTGLIIALSGLSLKTAIGSTYRMYLFFILIFLMNTCFFSTENAWFSFWIIHPTLAGVMQGFNVVFRVFLVLILSNVLTCTTTPMEVTNALESLISPLRFVKIPPEQIALIISVAIQFIPTLFEETDMIRKAQTARGAKFDSPKLTEKAVAVLPLTIPIFLSAFKRADELSLAMEARGYSSKAKRKMKKSSPLHLRDFVTISVALALCVVQIVIL